MAIISSYKVGTTNYSMTVPFVTTDTAAATAAKTATATGLTLVTGTQIKLKFTNGNTVANLTLNINSLGAKSILGQGGGCLPTLYSAANSIMSLIYDGTGWRIL